MDAGVSLSTTSRDREAVTELSVLAGTSDAISYHIYRGLQKGWALENVYARSRVRILVEKALKTLDFVWMKCVKFLEEILKKVLHLLFLWDILIRLA